MRELTSRKEIGSYLSVDVQEGDHLNVECDNGSFQAEVIEIRGDLPLDEGETREIVAYGRNSDSDTLYTIHVHITKLDMLHPKYDVYAIEMPDRGDDTSLGSVKQIVITNT